jgi:hypothetical protein
LTEKYKKENQKKIKKLIIQVKQEQNLSFLNHVQNDSMIEQIMYILYMPTKNIKKLNFFTINQRWDRTGRSGGARNFLPCGLSPTLVPPVTGTGSISVIDRLSKVPKRTFESFHAFIIEISLILGIGF